MAKILNIIRQFSLKMECPASTINNNHIPLKKRILNGLTDSEKFLVVKCSDTNAVSIAAKQLSIGNIIAIPTDTVYGFACNANDPRAIQKLYDVKGRDSKNPVAMCVSNVNNLKHYGEAKHLPNDLLETLLPGAVTIILNKTKYLDNPFLNPGIAKIAIRIPDFDFIREVTGVFEFPIALTSANKSNEKSTLDISEFQSLWMQLGAVFDAGRVGLTEEQRAASTIVDLSKPGFYKVTRNGVAVKNTISILQKFGLIADS